MNDVPCLFRAKIFHFFESSSTRFSYFDDGGLLVAKGKILDLGDFATFKDKNSDFEVVDLRPHLIFPGLIDSHSHYVQADGVGAFGKPLFEWLSEVIFPLEIISSDYEYSRKIAKTFLFDMVKNGTTTGLVLPSVFNVSVSALFEEAKNMGMSILSGKVLMDQNVPEELVETVNASYDNSCLMIKKWHNNDRLRYVVIPRFLISCSESLWDMIGSLVREKEGLLFHTHLLETKGELSYFKETFGNYKNHIDFFDKYNLLGSSSSFAHCLYLNEFEWSSFRETKTSVVHCPSANFSLGSGMFVSDNFDFRTAIGTDIGAGNSLSLFEMMKLSYYISAVQGNHINILDLLYSVSMGAANILGLIEEIGNFSAGKYADFLVLDLKSSPLMSLANSRSCSIEEMLFKLVMLANSNTVLATYIKGKCLYHR